MEPYTRTIVDDIRDLAKLGQNHDFFFNCREANQVAHHFAHWGKSSVFEQFWIDDVPGSSTHLVLSDVRQEPLSV
ncbi:hypothetical protein ACS0TY_021344 [Phlomoides rotata]